jgi:competence protein ComEA
MVRELLELYKVPLIFSAIGLLFMITGFVAISSGKGTSTFEFQTNEASISADTQHTITVDIEGAVMEPGIYTIPFGTRVGELIDRAGGLSKDANSDVIARTLNKAQVLQDSDKLYISTIDEKSNIHGSGVANFNQSESKININTASSEVLESLQGVGDKTAEKIIDNRPYSSIEDLKNKKVMGEAVFEKIKSSISVL